MPIPLRRTIYIGVGGTGTDVIKLVRKHFIAESSDGNLPPMIKFLAVDTNQGDLNRTGFTTAEQLLCATMNPSAIYAANRGNYGWLTNVNNIGGIASVGAGQIRSNGAFLFSINENAFQTRLQQIVNSIQQINVPANDSFTLTTTNTITINLCFSLSGGTGSGMFLRMARAIKQAVPGCKLIGYAFSGSFFQNVGVNFNVKSNAFAALIEADYEMHSNLTDYGGTQVPFDGFMYIDNKTYTDHGLNTQYTWKFNEVEGNVAYSLRLSAGILGAQAGSTNDNLEAAQLSGNYDILCKNGTKSAWVSSLGICDIFCKGGAATSLFCSRLAMQELDKFRNGSVSDSDKTSKAWIKSLDINEGGPTDPDDHDGLINAILTIGDSPNSSLITVDGMGNINDSFFIDQWGIGSDTINASATDVGQQKKGNLTTLAMELLFPAQGGTIKGLTYLINVLTGFKTKITGYSQTLGNEIKELAQRKEEPTEQKETKIEELAKPSHLRSQSKVAELKNTVRSAHIKILKIDAEILRRQKAQAIYNELDQQASDLISNAEALYNTISAAITSLSASLAGKTERPAATSTTQVDVSHLVKNMPATDVTGKSIKDWSDFLKASGCLTLADLSQKKNWEQFTKDYVQQFYPGTGASDIIDLLDSLDDKTLTSTIRDSLDRSTPLMDVRSYGMPVRPSSFLIVAIPASADQTKAQRIKTAFTTCYKGNQAPDFMEMADTNHIVVYSQLGTVPPYYISGVSEGKNTIYDPTSCETDFKSSRVNHSNYSPFTTKQYEAAYDQKGHSLDSLLGGISDGDYLQYWVKGILRGLISRASDGTYRFESDVAGVNDMEDMIDYYSLSPERGEAYRAFCEALGDKNILKEYKDKLKSAQGGISDDIASLSTPTEKKKKYASLCLSSDGEREGDKDLLQQELACMLKIV